MKRLFDDNPVGAARRHAQYRFWERYCLALGEPDIRLLETQIWTGVAKWVCDSGGAAVRQIYIVAHGSRDALAVFDVRLGCIVTFLPWGRLHKLRAAA